MRNPQMAIGALVCVTIQFCAVRAAASFLFVCFFADNSVLDNKDHRQ